MSRNPITQIFIGVGIAVAALVITGATYLYAASQEGGGRYWFFWGAVIWGGWIALRGVLALPEYLRVQRSGTVIERAQYDPALAVPVLVETFRTGGEEERIRVLDALPELLPFATAAQVAPLYLWGLADERLTVQSKAYWSLVGCARMHTGKTKDILRYIVDAVGRDQALMRHWPQPQLQLAGYRHVLEDGQAFAQWSANGQFPAAGGMLA